MNAEKILELIRQAEAHLEKKHRSIADFAAIEAIGAQLVDATDVETEPRDDAEDIRRLAADAQRNKSGKSTDELASDIWVKLLHLRRIVEGLVHPDADPGQLNPRPNFLSRKSARKKRAP